MISIRFKFFRLKSKKNNCWYFFILLGGGGVTLFYIYLSVLSSLISIFWSGLYLYPSSYSFRIIYRQFHCICKILFLQGSKINIKCLRHLYVFTLMYSNIFLLQEKYYVLYHKYIPIYI